MSQRSLFDESYGVAEIYYNTWDKTYPWILIITGEYPEQGGVAFTNTTLSFKTIEELTEFAANKLNKDLPVIKKRIEYTKNETK